MSENISEPDVIQIADEIAGGMWESQRVTPEEPLETDDSDRHER